MSRRVWVASLFWLIVLSLPAVFAQQNQEQKPAQAISGYVLGPDDQVRMWVLGLEDVFDKPFRIDANGTVDLPLVGPIVASGLTVDEFKAKLTQSLERELKHPIVSVTVTEFGSEPVSVLGAVNSPGVHQLHGRMTLAEVLSQAGGLRPDAGSTIMISRQAGQPPLPFQSTKLDSSGDFSVAEVKVQDVMEARNSDSNIGIQPHDVVTVPRGQMVYVIGAVHKPGGFVLHERDTISVLHALSLAEGLGSTPAAQNSRILRVTPGSRERQEIPVDLSKVLAGKAENLELRPDDILLVPTSNGKKAGVRALEAVVQAATGVAIWGRY